MSCSHHSLDGDSVVISAPGGEVERHQERPAHHDQLQQPGQEREEEAGAHVAHSPAPLWIGIIIIVIIHRMFACSMRAMAMRIRWRRKMKTQRMTRKRIPVTQVKASQVSRCFRKSSRISGVQFSYKNEYLW